MLDDIVDSHDLVQYMMLLMNVEAASKLISQAKAYLDPYIKNSQIPIDLPREIVSIARAWDHQEGVILKRHALTT